MSWTEASLIVLLCAQQAFYMRQTQKLVDKLMSRNYHEYIQAQAPSPLRPSAPQTQEASEDFRVLEGMVF